MSSIYSEKTLGGLQTFKKWLFRFAVGVLISGIVLGAMLILAGEGTDASRTLGSCMSTMFIIGIMLMVTTEELKLIESRRASVQVLATIGLTANLIWTVLWVIVAWSPELQDSLSCNSFYGCRYASLIKAAFISTELTLFGLICGALMNIYEGERKDVILPLKITAAVLAGYEFIFTVITILLDGKVNDRFVALSGFAVIVWIFVWLIALVLSKNERKRLANATAASATPAAPIAKPAKPATKSDDELRAEIEEKVRREMIEKEVREKLEKEAKASKADKK